MGRYRDESDEPLTEDDRRNIRKMLSDPLSFPDEFTGWLRGRTLQTIDDRVPVSTPASTTDPGPWKVYDSAAHSNQNGRIEGRCWQLDVPGVTQRLCGTAVNTSGPDRIVRAWTNAYDGTDEQFDIYRPGTYDDVDPVGWAGSKVILAEDSTNIHLCDYDGTNRVQLYGPAAVSCNAFPQWANNRVAQNRVWIIDGGDLRRAKFDGSDTSVYTSANPLQDDQQAGTNNISVGQTPQRTPRINGDGRALVLICAPNYGYPGELINTGAGTLLLTLDHSDGAANSSDCNPQFSPDGKWVSWTVYGTISNDYELWVADTATLTKQQIPAAGGYVYGHWWAPSSDCIIYTDSTDLFICDIQGAAPQSYYTSASGVLSDPQWFGDAIVFVEDDGVNTLLLELNPYDGTTTTIATLAPSGDFVNVVLSPNGSFVAHSQQVSAGVNDIWVARTNGLAA